MSRNPQSRSQLEQIDHVHVPSVVVHIPGAETARVSLPSVRRNPLARGLRFAGLCLLTSYSARIRHDS